MSSRSKKIISIVPKVPESEVLTGPNVENIQHKAEVLDEEQVFTEMTNLISLPNDLKRERSLRCPSAPHGGLSVSLTLITSEGDINAPRLELSQRDKELELLFLKPRRFRRIDNYCKQLLRFENDSIDFLASQFLPENIDTRGGAISSRQKMEILLRYFGDPGFQSGVAEDMGVHRSTVTKTVNYVMDCIIARADEWIHFPATPVEMNEAKILWRRSFSDANCNRSFGLYPPTINVQATCNAAEQFTSISAEWPGSVHDARIWRISPIRGIVSQYDGPVCLLGDSGYGISPWLITPFQSPRNGLEPHFNLIQARERCIIERLFGQLKKRFPILGNCVRVTSKRVPKVIISCAVLHNVAKHLNDVFDFNNEENEHEAVEGAIVDEQQETRATKARGIQKRNEMMQLINEM
ncbi:hypothetical protein NQ314_009555 [Rhamnusium bicolor]|uniref:DDE Tnp4 domain-containing protein n=1 Tax=Rhamnusium bicolor TaxID=1586634 RepID=A0AAV8Y008_9CUCU|nr:hypothetical protein NQ314_009555 [Rhamnusium bicolor]